MTTAPLVLVCKICRWHAPGNMEMTFIEAHFDIEPDHDPADITLELVAWCQDCDGEMLHVDAEEFTELTLHHYLCLRCNRTGTVTQETP